MKQFHFSMRISYQDFEAVYTGAASNVLVTDIYGKRIQIPALRFLPFLAPTGIVGSFTLTVDDNNKFVSLKRR
ncbi:DUF2835 domain-containing protein [Aliagarivorans marinus]|uniref:DUF2835 domain-containing protein n=1 Tax=Aliagarivorans marinus TaxID=561965 RepID=UPI00040A43BA|nr:DUF2835 domain-containing protein [Aliagarivorans marinus]